MALSNLDRELLRDCLEGNEEAWKGFCDRFIGLIVHTVHHVANSFRIRLDDSKRDDLVSDVFVTLLDNDFAALRRFRGESSLGSYLVVIARRTVTKRVLQWKLRGSDGSIEDLKHEPTAHDGTDGLHTIDWNEPDALRGLSDDEASAIRLFTWKGSRTARSAPIWAWRRTVSVLSYRVLARNCAASHDITMGIADKGLVISEAILDDMADAKRFIG